MGYRCLDRLSLALLPSPYCFILVISSADAGCVPFESDELMLADPAVLAKNIAWILAIPLWRTA